MGQNTLTPEGQHATGDRKRQITYFANLALLTLGIAVSLSGMIIQTHYHLQKSPDESLVLALNRPAWNTLHVWTSILFSAIVIHHILAHRKWYTNRLQQPISANHRPTILLTALTLLTILSGLTTLFFRDSERDSALRFFLIEIHDKLAILFFIVVLRHTAKRFRWYIHSLKNKCR